MLRHIIIQIIRFRIGIMVLLALLMGLSGYQTFQKLRVDNSLAIWFLEDNPSYRAYIDYQEQYGSDEIFVGMIPVENAMDSLNILRLSRFHQHIDSLWFVKTSFSLAKAEYPIYAKGDISFQPLYNPRRSERGMKNLMSKLPNISQQLVTEDFKNLFFYIQLNPTPSIEAQRDQIAKDIREVIDEHYNDYYLTGAPVLNEAYSVGIYKESLIFGILTIGFISLMLLFLLPSKRYLIVSLLSVVVPISLLFGIITSFGFALNMISMLIPTILMVYSVSDAVHIINIYHKEGLLMGDSSKIDLLTLTVRRSFTPCFYTTLTTFVGYFALYLSPLPAFKEMGVFTCVGLLLSFILVYLVTIIGFSFMNIDFKSATPVLQWKVFNQSAVIQWLNQLTTKRQISIIVVSSIILVFGIFSVFKVDIDTNSLDLLAEGQAKDELRIVEQELNSSSRLQLNITTNKGSMLERENIKKLESFQTNLEGNIFAAHPVSIVNLKQFLEARSPILFQSNINEEKIKFALQRIGMTDNQFFTLVSDDFKTTGLVLGVKEIRTSELETLLDDIKIRFKEQFDPDSYDLKINGFSVVFSQLNNFILETQFKSFFAAFFVGFLCLFVFIRNIRTTILVLIPNVLPLAILAIFMSLLDIPLDVSTAMITPIMLGIAMDDTIHLVYKYRKSKTIKGTPEERMDNAMRYTGSALFSTTIALVVGFLIIASSAVPSVRDFGLLCAVTVAIALLTDIFYLPALLKRLDR
ncbi:efflux RND transporter permease subunit [Winogradskyella aurantiaca]|uniref:efflux RND transporter permease subunit n=1 Tax=Winogradskyella aurantiaca TaxID=2219558 RepID=UPI001E31B174|nr:MMPL family transporter [Winogradskyella aurantiaca]